MIYLTAKMAGLTYAVPASEVKVVKTNCLKTRLVLWDSWAKGVLLEENSLVPIFDLSYLTGQQQEESQEIKAYIIYQAGEQLIALAATELRAEIKITEEEYEQSEYMEEKHYHILHGEEDILIPDDDIYEGTA